MKKILLLVIAMIFVMCFGLSFNKIEAANVSDTLTAANFEATDTTYTAFTGVTGTSGAVYAGNSAKNGDNIQLRSKNSNSGIVTTTSGGNVKSITIAVGSGTPTVDIYGKSSAYESAADLYDSKAQGSKIGTLNKDTLTLEVSGTYEYLGIRSNSGAIYLSSITIVWETATTGTTSPETGTTNPDGDNNQGASGETNSSNISSLYKEVTSLSEIENGREFYIGKSTDELINTIEEKALSITETNSPLAFKVESTSDAKYLKTGDTYVAYSGSSTSLEFLQAKSNNGKITLSLDGSNIVIKYTSSSSRLLMFSSTSLKNYASSNADTSGYSYPKFYVKMYDYEVFQTLTTKVGLSIAGDNTVQIRFGSQLSGDSYNLNAKYGVILTSSANQSYLDEFISKSEGTSLADFIAACNDQTHSINYLESDKVHLSTNPNHEFYWRVTDVDSHRDYEFYAVMYMELNGQVYFSQGKVASVISVATAYNQMPALMENAEVAAKINAILGNGGTN